MLTDTQTQEPLTVHIRPDKPKDYRCPHCGKLLFRAVLVAGCHIEIRDRSCGRIVVLEYPERKAAASVSTETAGG
jgi:phage FluMu protein Com